MEMSQTSSHYDFNCMQGQRGPPDGGPGVGRVRGRRGRRGAPPARPHVNDDAQGEVL